MQGLGLEELISSTIVEPTHKSLDTKWDIHGQTLTDFCLSNSFLKMNGNCKSDSPAMYTNISKLGASIVDYVFADCDAIKNLITYFAIANAITSHQIIHMKLNINSNRATKEQIVLETKGFSKPELECKFQSLSQPMPDFINA